MTKQPWERDPTGLFYVPPGNQYGSACLLGCGLVIAWVAISGAVALWVNPQLGALIAVVLFVVFWLWDR